MANETTMAIAEGLMRIAQTYINTNVGEFSRLYGSTRVEETNNYNQIYWGSTDNATLTGVTTALTDGDSPTVTTNPSQRVVGTLQQFPVLKLVTDQAIWGGIDVVGTIQRDVGRQAGNTIDKQIYSNALGASGESVSATDGMTYDLLMDGVAALQAKGLYGPYSFIGDPRHIRGSYGILNDIASNLYSPTVNDEIVRGTGFKGVIDEVEIYSTHQATKHSSDTYAYGILFDKNIVAMGHRSPLIELSQQRALWEAGVYVNGNVFMTVDVLNSAGGYLFDAKIA